VVTPDIQIKIDPKEDVKTFLSFLNHSFFVQKRSSILDAHPKLKEYADDPDFKDRVEEYVLEFYNNNQEKIDGVVEKNRKKLKGKDRALEILASLMGYNWGEAWKIDAYVTILPFSPFSDRKFNYSILGELYDKNPLNKSLLSVAVHEISHMIFFDQLEKMGIGSVSQNSAIYYLKEALTTSLMNNQELRRILKTKKELGNPDIRDIYVQKKGKRFTTLVNYMKNELKQPQGFIYSLKPIVHRFIAAKKQFDSKKELWDKHGKKIFSDQKLLDAYSSPVKIK